LHSRNRWSREPFGLPFPRALCLNQEEQPQASIRFFSSSGRGSAGHFQALEDIMAYDRYDTRDTPRDDRSRWSSDGDRGRWSGENRGRDRWSSDDRGFFERAGDEVASWFGDEEAERRREQDRRMDERGYGDREQRGWGSESGGRWQRERIHPQDQGDRGYVRPSRGSRGFAGNRERDRDYQPMTGDYGRSEQFFATGAAARGSFGRTDDDESFYERSRGPWARDDYRRTGFAGSSERSSHPDPHYHELRRRHLDELDRDYDDYRRENQARFEDDFTSWRERRVQKRGLLGRVREHMEVVGSDDERVGTVDRVAGDRIILTKSDPESGGAHHSLSCSEIETVEGDRIVLNCSAEQARQLWRDESRGRALFEREDQGEMGDRVLDRSFEGTYR
jgi:hypothetical protein